MPGERSTMINAGAGGAEMLVRAMQDDGLPEEFIKEQIEVYLDGYGWIPLSAVQEKDLEKPE